jgi:hypothetical protein
VSGTTVTVVTAGTCVINADQAGNATYAAAPQVMQNITVNKANQVIAFNTVAGVAANAAPITLAATGGASGNAVTFASLTTTICTTGGTNGSSLSFVNNASGSCVVRASQAGNTNYNAATNVDRTIAVATVPPAATPSTTTVRAPATLVVGTPFAVTATVSGNAVTGTVSFSLIGDSDITEVCTSVTLVAGEASCNVSATAMGAGRYGVTANYGGNSNNLPSSGNVSVEVTKRASTISVSVSPTTVVAGRRVTITALITGTRATGTVAFLSGGEFLSSCAGVAVGALNAGGSSTTTTGVFSASCGATFSTTGPRNIIAVYTGDNNNAGAQASASLEVLAANAPNVQNAMDITNMWWAGAAENGWGIAILQRGTVQFNALYVYDDKGNPQWFVQPGTSYDPVTRSYTGVLYQPTSAPFSAYTAGSFAANAPVGTMTQTVSADGGTVTLTYTINGVTGSKILTPQNFADNGGGAPPLPVGDLWWGGTADPKENGWGINISQQGNGLFTTWYTYGADGKSTWFVLPAGSWTGLTYSGDLYSTTGSNWLGATYDPAKLGVNKVGTMTFTFTDANNATVTYTVNGVTQTKVINRQPF